MFRAFSAALMAAAIVLYGICVPFSHMGESLAAPPASPVTTGMNEEYTVHKVERNETFASLAKAYLGDEHKDWVIRSFNKVQQLSPGMTVVIPLKYDRRGGLNANGFQVVPVLVYHRFADSCKTPLCIAANVFEQQMKYLHDNGYRTIGLHEFSRFCRLEQTIPPRSVVLTIDDGYSSIYDIAYPILRKYGFTATLFIYTDFIEATGKALTWEQLNQLKKAGFEVEAHSKTHADLTARLADESEEQYHARVKQELDIPRALIREHLGYESVFFAYPFGKSNNFVREMLKEEKYELAFDVAGVANPFFTPPFSMTRIQVFNATGIKDFAGLLKTFHEQDLR